MAVTPKKETPNFLKNAFFFFVILFGGCATLCLCYFFCHNITSLNIKERVKLNMKTYLISESSYMFVKPARELKTSLTKSEYSRVFLKKTILSNQN